MNEILAQVELNPPPQSVPNAECTNLLGLDRVGLEEFFASIGEKKFRATQVMKWIHQLGVVDFQQMNLSDYPNLKRWYLNIASRPAVQRGYGVPDVLEVPLPE